MQEIKRKLSMVVIVAILFLTGFVFANMFSTQDSQTKLGVPVAFGDDDDDDNSGKDENKDEDDEDDEKNDEEDDDKDEDEDEDEDKGDEDDDEDKEEVKVRIRTSDDDNDDKDEDENERADKDKEDDEDEMEDDAEDATKEINKLQRNLSRVEVTVSGLEAGGVDVSGYKEMLADIQESLDRARSQFSEGMYKEAETTADLAERKLGKIKDLIEGEDDEDETEIEIEIEGDDISGEYKSKIKLFVRNLEGVGEVKSEIKQQVKAVAQSQDDSQLVVEKAVAKIKSKNRVSKFFFGPEYDSIAEIKNTIIGNQTRIDVLTELINQMDDPTVKMILQDQVDILNQQNTNLQNFVSGNEGDFSLFGWLVRLFN